jgi:hypothetical protein
MTRAVFQVVSNQPADLIMIKGGQEKGIPINEDTTAMMACLPFKKPKEKFVHLDILPHTPTLVYIQKKKMRSQI